MKLGPPRRSTGYGDRIFHAHARNIEIRRRGLSLDSLRARGVLRPRVA